MLTCTWVSTAVCAEGPIPNGPHPDVYVFRGVIGYWPDAFGMAARMSNRGYCPHLQRSCDVPRLTSELKSAEPGARGPIYLIGYSYGASAAVSMARDLMEHGISVDRLVLIECYDYPEIPANVRYCVNIYESRRLDRFTVFRGTPARADDSSSTMLIDIDIASAPEWEGARQNNHFNMADDPRVQDFVAQQFPDVMQSIPADTSAVRVETFALPHYRSQAVAAPTQQVFSPAYGYPNSTHNGTRPEPSGLPSSSPYGSYRNLPQNNQFHMANDPQGQRLAAPPISNLTQQAWGSGYGPSNPAPQMTRPEPSGVPRSSAYSSYRVQALR